MDNFIPLEAVKIATPCRADWNKMQGDDHARFCQSCHKNVYNLSQMTREEAEDLIREKEGDLCARFYQRADGTVITADCPVGKSVARRPFWGLAAGFAALIASGVSLLNGANAATTNSPNPPITPTNNAPWQSNVDRLREMPVVGKVVNLVSPAPTPPPMVMGMIACPAPTPKPHPTAKPKKK